MNIHREGKVSIIIALVICFLLTGLIFYLSPNLWWINLGWLLALLFILNFFRNPDRTIKTPNENWFYSPADGKVVVLEETFEKEFLQEKRLLLSIFMSPLDVHANRIPISGKVIYSKYQEGQYLPAFNPKSSELNERHSIIIDNSKHQILVRQIAGIMARRICNYCVAGVDVHQGDEMGFIKFGSRVDIFFPIGTQIKVNIGQKVKGNIDVLAELD